MDFLFDEIPNNIVPFDFERFLKCSETFIVGTTDCHTGEPVYFDKQKHGEHMLKLIRASSSVPFISPSVPYEDKLLLDGGIADPIPIKRAQLDGNRKNVVIMTKPAKYINAPGRLSMLIKYKKHPKIGELLIKRHLIYNETISYLKKEEKQGNVFIIEPSKDLPISSIERNQTKLQQLFDLGYHDAQKSFKELSCFSRSC